MSETIQKSILLIVYVNLTGNFMLSGDVAFRILDSVNSIRRRAMQDVLEDDLQEETKIYVCDINPNMLNVGKKRALERGQIML